MSITIEQLKRIMPRAGKRADVFLAPLNAAMAEFDITTPRRMASFLSQIGHESGQLAFTKEIWGPTPAQARYEGRLDLSNMQPGDGKRFSGRGFIQVTGRANYTACMMALDIDCVEHPELLELPINACRSAGWFWKTHGLNELADAGDQVKLTKRINGGINGLADRLELYLVAADVLGPQ